jgi:hypothetical protein
MQLRWLLFLLVSFSMLYAQDDITLNGNGARAAGMGYAFTGIADDATAIAWNPAGLTQLYSMEASLIGRFGFGFLSTNYTDFNPDVKIGSKFQLNFASFAMPFNVGEFNVVGGLAYRRMYDFTKDVTITFDEEVMGQSIFIESISDNSGGVNAIAPAFGVQLNEMFSVGATFNILTGSTDYSTSYTAEYLGVSESEESSYTESYSGLAIDIGALVKPNPQFSVGASLKLPYTIGAELEEEGETMNVDIDMPFMFDIGLAWRASDKFTLAADYKNRPIADIVYKSEYAGETTEFKPFSKDDNEDLNDDLSGTSFHAGMEYLAQTGNNVMPLRLGVFTQPTTTTDVNGDQISFLGLATGIGLVLNNIVLDGSFEWIIGSYVGALEGDNNDEDVTYTSNEFRVTIGAVIHLGQ